MAADHSLESFFVRLADAAGTALISAGEADAVLDLARVVAHGIERRYAPLTAYALGLALHADADPVAREARVRAVIDVIHEMTRD